jgi:hypothetical protein
VFKNPTFFIDLLTAIWIMAIVSGIFIALPSILLGDSAKPTLRERKTPCPLDRLANGFSRMITLTSLGALLWARLSLLTWLTAALTILISLFAIWVFGSDRHPTRKINQIEQKFLASAIDLLDRGVAIRPPVRFIGSQVAKVRAALQLKDSATAICFVIMFLVLILSWYGRFQHPLSELRFTTPESYSQLLITQEILSRDASMFDAPTATIQGRVPVLAALTAIISFISSTNPIHTQHFTLAIVGCWLVAALGYGLWKLSDNLAASTVGMLGIGVYLFTWSGKIAPDRSERTQAWLGNIVESLNQGWIRQWNPGELELGAIFLILGLTAAIQIGQPARRFDGLLSGTCCILMLLMTAPPLMLLLLVGGIGLIIGRPVALLAITITWLSAALLVALPSQQLMIDPVFLRTLPIALSLLMGILFLLFESILKGLLGNWTAVTMLALILGLTLNFGWPTDVAIERLEYEASARKTLEISRRFPYKNWTMVAPNEQLSQSFQQGWHEDLAKFVKQYQEPVESPAFQLPFKTSNIFVMVEKQPFSSDKEFDDVPFSTLNDPVYNNYRSSIGRSKLQASAMALCDTYAKNHPDSKIYYEDTVIKIYQFAGMPPTNDK